MKTNKLANGRWRAQQAEQRRKRKKSKLKNWVFFVSPLKNLTNLKEKQHESRNERKRTTRKNGIPSYHKTNSHDKYWWFKWLTFKVDSETEIMIGRLICISSYHIENRLSEARMHPRECNHGIWLVLLLLRQPLPLELFWLFENNSCTSERKFEWMNWNEEEE